jgi:hypothetical protein
MTGIVEIVRAVVAAVYIVAIYVVRVDVVPVHVVCDWTGQGGRMSRADALS